MTEYISCPKCNARSKRIVNNPQKAVYRCEQCRHLTEVNHELPCVPPVRFSCFNHQGKADAFVGALQSKYEYFQGALLGSCINFVLTDSDIGGRQAQLRRMKLNNVRRFFVYPHAARPSLINAQYPMWEGTTAQLVVNEYHAEVLRAYGYEKPLISVGWSLSPVEDFKPRNTNNRPLRVLFAPIHPRNAPIDREMNKAAFDRLYPHVLSGEIQITVRHIGQLSDSGLEEKRGVNYVNGAMNQTTSDMDINDVVIAHQTYAWLAVARGIPCVMFAEDMPTHFRANGQYSNVPCWDKVHHLFRYPLDLLCENDTMKLLKRAAHSDYEIKDWKRRMIGGAFDPVKFVYEIERYL